MAKTGRRGRISRYSNDRPIFDVNGVPFYHKTCQTLSSDQKERLIKANVKLSNGEFRDVEDEKIRTNWKEFAHKHSIPSSDVLKYVGVKLAFTDDQQGTSERAVCRKFAADNDFIESMCQGLYDRTGASIRHRMTRLFDPNYVYCRNGRSLNWTSEDDKKLLLLHSIHGNDWMKIGQIMNRNNRTCWFRLQRIEKYYQNDPDKLYHQKHTYTKKSKETHNDEITTTQETLRPSPSLESPLNSDETLLAENIKKSKKHKKSDEIISTSASVELSVNPDDTVTTENARKRKKKKHKHKKSDEVISTSASVELSVNPDDTVTTENARKRKKKKHKHKKSDEVISTSASVELSVNPDDTVTTENARKRKKKKHKHKKKLAEVYELELIPVEVETTVENCPHPSSTHFDKIDKVKKKKRKTDLLTIDESNISVVVVNDSNSVSDITMIDNNNVKKHKHKKDDSTNSQLADFSSLPEEAIKKRKKKKRKKAKYAE